MSSVGFGIWSTRLTDAALQVASISLPPLLAPHTDWDGTEGSGFEAFPVDPVRTTAKPACRLITPPRRWFTDTVLVGVDAWANNEGSLLNCGLEKVVFHYEGQTVELTQPSFRSLPDANGRVVTYFGWWVLLSKPPGVSGHGNLYVEAVPIDPTMQSRVIGPYLFSPQDQQHDLEVEVTPSQPEIIGARFQTLDDATSWLKTQSPQNPRIRITEPGKYEMLANAGGSYTDMQGRLLIEATVPDVSIGRLDYTDDSEARIRHNAFPLHLRGENLTIDLRYVTELDGGLGFYEDGMHWLDGCTLTSTSPEGRFEHLRGGKIDFFGWRVDGSPWFTEVNITNIAGALGRVSLARGCTLDAISYDIASDSVCVIDCTVTDHSNSWWSTDHKSLSVIYTGSEPTATFERSGGADSNGATFTAEWGSNFAEFAVGQSEAYFSGTNGDGYSVQDVVEWVNTLPGWSANLSTPDDQSLYPDLRDQRAGRVSTSGRSSKSFGKQNVKDNELQLYIGYHRHGDFFQHSTGVMENVIIRGNRVDGEMQSVFIGPINDGRPRDMFILANVFNVSTATHDYYDSDNSSSQIGKRDVYTSHVVLAHNSWINQGLLIRTDSQNMDMLGYDLIANNVLRELRFAGPEDSDAAIVGNHIYGPEAPPSIATGSSQGGSISTLFADALGGDFSPAGELTQNGKNAVLEYDLTGSAYALPSAVPGALAASASGAS